MAISDFLKKHGILEDDAAPEQAKKAAPVPAAVTEVQAKPVQAVTGAQASASDPAVQIQGPDGAESILDVESIRSGIEARIKSQPEAQVLAKFLQTANGMKNSVKDDATRFKAAAEIVGVKFEDLQKGLAVVQPVLDSEKHDFDATFVASVNTEIHNVQMGADKLEQMISDKSEELGKLTDERASLIAQTIKKQTSLDKAIADFKSVTSTVSSDYAELASKLERHLKS